MKPGFTAACFLAIGLLLATPSLFGHHSFTAEFDGKKEITVKGTVTKVEWTNPHIYFYVDVKDDSGQVVNWAFEGYPPSTLRREGWTRDMLKAGQAVTVFGYAAKDGSHVAAARRITLPDGKALFASAPPQ